MRAKRVTIPLKYLLCLTVPLVYQTAAAEETYGDTENKLTAGTTLPKNIPIIIWWCGRLFLQSETKELRCPASTCYSTKDRSLLEDPRTRAIYFYGTDMEPEDLPLPRLPRHQWALLHEESPMNNYMLSHGKMIKLFNYTATFRRESDFPLTSQSLPCLEYLTSRQPVSIAQKNAYRKKGLAPIVYVQSHCHVASDRDRYVRKLMEEIDIDSYGECENNKPIPVEISDPVESMHDEKFLDFLSRYKFHLAFENAICSDYMTEKLFRPLHVGSVPIYRGSPRVKDWMPSDHAVIVVDDFDSPKDLAKFIKMLDEDDVAYARYIDYKEEGISNEYLIKEISAREWSDEPNDSRPDMFTGFECLICDEISKWHQSEEASDGDNSASRIAQSSHLSCPQPYTSVGDPDDYGLDDDWNQLHWIEDYWTGLDKATVINEMLRKNISDSSTFDEMWIAMENAKYQRPSHV